MIWLQANELIFMLLEEVDYPVGILQNLRIILNYPNDSLQHHQQQMLLYCTPDKMQPSVTFY